MTLVAWMATEKYSKQAVEGGRDALQSMKLIPWYDPAKDELKPIRLGREPVKEYPVEPWKGFDFDLPTWFVDIFGDLIRVVGYVLLFALLALVIYLIYRAYLLARGQKRRGKQKVSKGPSLNADIDRIENLPFELEAPRGDLLEEARRRYEMGDYRLAIIYLYSYQLIRLDEHQFIKLTLGKTNRQYLREVRQTPPLARILEQTMVTFEDVFFGHYKIGRDEFEPCWQSLSSFHQIVQQQEKRS
ncbi:MAG: DUF4129 domain-containing protein [Planctomycetota bacterium]